MQGLLLLEMGVRLWTWMAALVATLYLAMRFDLLAPFQPPDFRMGRAAWNLATLVLVFNASYLMVILLIRALIPQPRPGRYSLADRVPDRALLWSSLIAIITKTRYQPPFPAFLVPQMANIYPFHWFFRWKFGPNSRSPFFVEPYVLDPAWITIGRNVTIGFGTTISGHLQERDHVTIAPTVIEDDVLIGALTAIPGGVHIKRGAVIRGYSMILPGTVVGENEFWGGIPARRIKQMDDTPPSADAARPSDQNLSDAACV
jgi:acetyltransferase-like isoleucine patch superfamily enzyme